MLSCLLFQLNSCVNPWIYLAFNFKCGSSPAKKKEEATSTVVTNVAPGGKSTIRRNQNVK